ncbi:hypothetical protein EJ03DRAFT_382657 [Teratosphaeria nubilosa]|uniref:Uncharacterized protein n=1 Tax=Teratosphaeria nubilosa TaxID=161662 RepID=A0A6G1L9K0_9PEZI|nr:hypothetical protein EJ03DRAFT_382657 [Teratosphaeria nubilosa]
MESISAPKSHSSGRRTPCYYLLPRARHSCCHAVSTRRHPCYPSRPPATPQRRPCTPRPGGCSKMRTARLLRLQCHCDRRE